MRPGLVELLNEKLADKGVRMHLCGWEGGNEGEQTGTAAGKLSDPRNRFCSDQV